jgi:3-hydroxybutyryl-CoA dehydrogenase
VIEVAFIFRNRETVKTILDTMGWNYTATADIEGFITPRIIAMIINEAYFAIGEDVSTKAQIDVAMKAGTNYPYGPFAWAEKIGKKRISDLLLSMYKTNARYQPAPALSAELA